jgi:hypothetical protein
MSFQLKGRRTEQNYLKLKKITIFYNFIYIKNEKLKEFIAILHQDYIV